MKDELPPQDAQIFGYFDSWLKIVVNKQILGFTRESGVHLAVRLPEKNPEPECGFEPTRAEVRVWVIGREADGEVIIVPHPVIPVISASSIRIVSRLLAG